MSNKLVHITKGLPVQQTEESVSAAGADFPFHLLEGHGNSDFGKVVCKATCSPLAVVEAPRRGGVGSASAVKFYVCSQQMHLEHLLCATYHSRPGRLSSDQSKNAFPPELDSSRGRC